VSLFQWSRLATLLIVVVVLVTVFDACRGASGRRCCEARMTHAAIHITGLEVRAGSRILLQIPELRVRQGERVAVVGPNGAGKSTLLRVLSGFMPAHQGRVSVLGRTWGSTGANGLGSAEMRRLRADVGQVMQGLHLVPRLTARENVILGALARPGAMALWQSWLRLYPGALVQEADQALRELGLARQADLRADQLSGGERQKVGMARVRLQRARLILADEPTSALDPTATSDVCQALCALAQGMTLVTVVHNPDLLPLLADRVIAIASGRLVFDVPVAQASADRLSALYSRPPGGALLRRGAGLKPFDLS
jgi:phosphonate transport system ATP-binding protein